MANQPESPTWRAGVFQLETETPVRGGTGGESNTPLLNLADRTAWLRQQVDAIQAALLLLAPITSPDFTGTPQAVTPPDGDATRKIVTTEWVQALIRGALTLPLTGGAVTLTTTEAGRGIITFTGTLTSNATVSIPAGIPGRWAMRNATTGAFSLTVRVTGGASVVIGQGRIQTVFSDGVNLYAGTTEAADLALTGTPTAPTATPATNTTQLATTAYARRLARGAASITATGGATITLTDTQSVSPVVLLTGAPASAFTVIFPGEAGRWTVVNTTGRTATLRTSGQAGGVALSAGRVRDIVTDGTNVLATATESTDHLLGGAPAAATPAPSAAGGEVVTAEWVRTFLAGQALYNTGDLKMTMKAVADAGWLFCHGGTIGNAASAATARANADTEPLFTLLWATLPDSIAPVSGGRGGSAAADFAAGKRITLPDLRGRALVGAGAGPGLTARALGATFGTETHTLTITELPEHNHGGATGAGGGHGHSASTGDAGWHTHAAWTGDAGAHSHAAASDTQGQHSHYFRTEGRAGNLPDGVPDRDGVTNWNEFQPGVEVYVNPAGDHAHNITIGTAGSHTHGVGLEGNGTHSHAITIAAAPDHQHTIAVQGGNAAHPNVPPSIAINIMVKL